MTSEFTASDQQEGRPPVTVRGPAALAAALPYLLQVPLLGRIVVTGVEAGRFAQGASHTQLPGYPAGGSAEVRAQWSHDVGGLIAQGVLAAQPAAGFVAVVLYLPAGVRLDDPIGLRQIRSSVPLEALARTLDIVAVADGRWRSILCRNQDCCPSEGRTILDDKEAVRVCAELIGAGMASAATPDHHRAAAVRAALAELPWPDTFQAREQLLRRVWPMLAHPAADLTPEETACLVLAADRPGVRDALLARLARLAKADGSSDAGWSVQDELWQRVAVAAPREWLAGPACMMAIARWAQGDNEAAARAAIRALTADPEHRMAGLIRQLLRSGVRADEWMSRVAGLSEDDCLRFDRPPTLIREEQRRAG